MALIDFYIRNQKLSKTGPKIVADSINYISCSFTFKTDDWNGMDKWVSFKKGEEAYNVNLVDDAIPKEVGLNLGEGVWTVLVFGEGENTRITTNTVTVEVEGSAIPEGGPLPAIELTEAEQIAAKAQKALNAAEEVKTKAENGDFNGEPGKTPNIQIGEVATLEPGTKATASITGTLEEPRLNLGIPKGDPGEPGEGGNAEVTAESIENALGYVPAKPSDIPKVPANVSAFNNDAGYITKEDIPAAPEAPVQSVNGKTGAVQLTATDVGAEKAGAVAEHNISESAHNDIRIELTGLKNALEAFFDIDDPTLDQLSELIQKIEANAGTIEQLTNGKVNVADIVNDLVTNVANKPLSAAQGVVLKGLVDDAEGKLFVVEGVADNAKLAAEEAQTTAEGAKNTAVEAFDKADTALTELDIIRNDATEAKDAAFIAKEKAESAQDTVDDLAYLCVRYDVAQNAPEDYKAQARANIGISAAEFFVSPDGSDSNDGLTKSTPKKTFKACINAGAKRISAKRGVYNEFLELYNIGELEIFPTDNNLAYAVGTEREPIVFDTSDTVAISSFATYNSIKRVAYSNSANTQFDKVFVAKSLSPVIGDGYGSRYNSTIWLLSEDEKTVCIKLKPVLTVAECEAEANTFTYVSGYIYINADWTNVTKVIVPTNWDSGFYINGADKVVLKEVEVRFSGTYNFDLKNCAFFDLYKCSAKYTSYASGFHPENSNGKMTACYATKNYDGYGISGYGHTTYIDCVSEFNFDDGMSHHEGCEGTVIGGRYEGNGKGGNTPAYGAKVNIYGGIYKNNASFGIGYLWATNLEPASGMVQGAVMVDNPIGLRINANCDVIAMNCNFKSNTTDIENKGNLVEYNANYVKSVNGVLPDENGNVEVALTPAFVNQLPIATDASGAIYNGVGYKNGYRLNSSATEKEMSGCGHTGFIPATGGSVMRFKDIPACQAGYGYIHYFKSDKATVANACLNIVDSSFTADENGVYSYTLPTNSAIAYIRFSYGEMSENSIITIDEEIV